MRFLCLGGREENRSVWSLNMNGKMSLICTSPEKDENTKIPSPQVQKHKLGDFNIEEFNTIGKCFCTEFIIGAITSNRSKFLHFSRWRYIGYKGDCNIVIRLHNIKTRKKLLLNCTHSSFNYFLFGFKKFNRITMYFRSLIMWHTFNSFFNLLYAQNFD